jgi:hypothetical protein
MPDLSFEASNDASVGQQWPNEQGGGIVPNWNLGGTASLDEVSDPAVPGITKAYNTPQATANIPLSNSSVLSASSATTWEIWMRVPSFSGNHFIVETGGGANGTQLDIRGDQLNFVSQMNTTAGSEQGSVSHTLSANQAGQFIQVTGVIEKGDSGSGAATMRLFVDGSEVGTPYDASGELTSWSGSNVAGLGALGGSAAPVVFDPASPFDGDIALQRYYDQALSAAQVEEAYQSVIPEPTSLALLSLGGLMLAGRRRGA